MTSTHYNVIERLTQWAVDHGRGLNELAQTWLLAQSQVCSVISGATSLAQVLSNAKAATWTLTADEVAEVNALLLPNPS